MLRNLADARAFTARRVATDASATAVAGRFAERFLTVPRGDDPGYADALERLVRRERIDVIVPLTDVEVMALHEVGERTGTPVAAPSREAARKALDKSVLSAELGLDGAASPALARTPEELAAAVRRVGYPDRDVVVKPCRGTGARGVWVLSSRADGGRVLFERSAIPSITLDHFLALAPESFAPVLAMPRYLGAEYTVSCLTIGAGRRTLPVRRSGFQPGMTSAGTFERRDELAGACERLVDRLGLTPICNVQLIDDGEAMQVLEVNPRLSTTSTACAAAGVNLPEALVADALGLGVVLGEPEWGTCFGRYHAETTWREGS